MADTPDQITLTKSQTRRQADAEGFSPWPALIALCVGFFMILVDSTIVSVATPDIISSLHSDINDVVWVTSAYLLAYAVPLLITGRLGDRYGPKNVYLVGLAIFTLASLWCGLTGSIGTLIVARVFQGLGAALLAPQTMSVITRIFPAERRGQAMGFWGAVAGVATLAGPILGGVLVDQLSWEWIFFINVPVGVIGFGLAMWLCRACRCTATASTGSGWGCRGSACSCWSSGSRRATNTTGAPSPGSSRCPC